MVVENGKPYKEKNLEIPPKPVIVAKTIHNWPAGYKTKTNWKYECGRLLKKGAKPTFVEIKNRKIPVYHISQTRVSFKGKTELQEIGRAHV